MSVEFDSLLEKIEIEIKKSLPSCAAEDWKQASFGEQNKFVENKNLSQLIEPCSDLISRGGKRWRPLLLVLTAMASLENKNISEAEKQAVIDAAFSLTPVVEFVHNASLIHDDIEDSSDTRRGKPAIHLIWGNDVAINTGTWLYFQAAQNIQSLNIESETKLKLLEQYIIQTRTLLLGQAMDIKWHNDKQYIPTPEEYMQMVKNKTGTLSSLALTLGLILTEMEESRIHLMSQIAAEIGAGFQIIDDVINLTTGNPGKKRGDDIVEGKKSLPVLYFAQSEKEKLGELENYFIAANKEGTESASIEKAISLIEKSGAIEKAKSTGINLIENSCRRIKNEFGNENKYAQMITDLFLKMIPKSL